MFKNIYSGVIENKNTNHSIEFSVDDFSGNKFDCTDGHARPNAKNPIRFKLYSSNGNSSWRFVSNIEEARNLYRFFKNATVEELIDYITNSPNEKPNLYNNNTKWL